MAAGLQQAGENPFAKFFKMSEMGMAIGIIFIVVMLIIPMPSWLLDLFITFNIAIGVIILLISIYITNPLEFAVFPTMLLVTTLFRLAINVSTTRMILLNGHVKHIVTGEPIGAGDVIPAFGKVVIGGEIVVGLVVFIILIVIQLMVITAGAERIAQVAARFTLDAMPGKQMAIDADLHSGLIDADSAKLRRRQIEKEADFYGAMDGAGKFVKGDSIAAIIILLVNILAGIVIGVVMRKMDVGDALQTYTLLSVGDGLCSTLPAFLISTAMGMVVSRAASEADLGRDVVTQITAQPGALKLAAGFMLAMGLVAPIVKLPWYPFILMTALFFGVAHVIQKSKTQIDVHQETVKEEGKKEQKKKPESVVQLMQVDIISLEVGRGLLSLVDPNQGAKLLERVTSIRRHIAMELGIVVPGVRFKDNLQLRPNAYVIKIKEIEMATGEVMINQFLAIGPEDKLRSLRGTKTVDPTYGLPGVWLSPEQRGDAERLGCMIFDPVSVIATQLTEVIRTNAADLLGRQEVQALVDTVKKTHPAVVKELVPDTMQLGDIQKILQNLVRERVSIRDLVTILETIADNIHVTKDVEILTECVRVALSRVICRDYMNNEGIINVITLEPQVEQIIGGSIQRSEVGTFLALDPNIGQEILTKLSAEIDKLQEQGLQPMCLVAPQIRPAFRKLVERSFPTLVVLSWNEIAPKVNVNSVGMVVF
jgi:flagellar biosynthesis protein FlhA